MPGPLYIALLHYPVLDREGRRITSAVTNADIHDIARAAKTYGVRGVFIATPIPEQADLVKAIIGHWTHGAAGWLNPFRREALEAVEVAIDLAEIVEAVARREEGRPVHTVATGARPGGHCTSHGRMREILEVGEGAYLLIFGTGWGLAGEVLDCCRYRLEPIRGPEAYNHLSVRSAVAVMLDRLVGIRS